MSTNVEKIAALRSTLAKLKAYGILADYNIGADQFSFQFAEGGIEKFEALCAAYGRKFDADLAIFRAGVEARRNARQEPTA